MRIALFHNLPSGGAKRHTFEQIKRLHQRGYEIEEFVPSSANIDFCSLTPYIKDRHIFNFNYNEFYNKKLPFITPYIHFIQGCSLLNKTREVNHLIAKEINKGLFDFVFVKDCFIMPSPYILRYIKNPSIFQCHHVQRSETINNYDSNKPLIQELKDAYYFLPKVLFKIIMKRHEKINIKKSTILLTNSNYSVNVLKKRFDLNAIKIYPGIDTNIFRPLNVKKGDYVLSVGAIRYLKGFRFLLESLSQINSIYRPKLIISSNSIDPSEEKIIKKMSIKFGIELQIIQITNTEELVNLYNKAKVFLYSPYQEALGLAPLEAMACGTPVIAVGECGVIETVPNGVAGYLVERDLKIFAEKLESLLSNEDTRYRMGDAGIDYINKLWDWEQAITKL